MKKNKSYDIENKIFHFLQTHYIYFLLSRTFLWLNSLKRSFILAFITFLVHIFSTEHLTASSFLFLELRRRFDSFRFFIFLIFYRIKLLLVSSLLRRINWHKDFIAKLFRFLLWLMNRHLFLLIMAFINFMVSGLSLEFSSAHKFDLFHLCALGRYRIIISWEVTFVRSLKKSRPLNRSISVLFLTFTLVLLRANILLFMTKILSIERLIIGDNIFLIEQIIFPF